MCWRGCQQSEWLIVKYILTIWAALAANISRNTNKCGCVKNATWQDPLLKWLLINKTICINQKRLSNWLPHGMQFWPHQPTRMPNSSCCYCSSQKPSHGNISGTKRGIIDPHKIVRVCWNICAPHALSHLPLPEGSSLKLFGAYWQFTKGDCIITTGHSTRP